MTEKFFNAYISAYQISLAVLVLLLVVSFTIAHLIAGNIGLLGSIIGFGIAYVVVLAIKDLIREYKQEKARIEREEKASK